jgi:hypothetical protein
VAGARPGRYPGPVRPALLAALLVAAAPAAARAYDPFEDAPPGGGERPRLHLTAWGGALNGAPGSGRSGTGSLAGGEVGWSFDELDLGVQALAAQLDPERSGFSPLLLVRLGQRLETRRGVEATFTVGLGAARRGRWEGWFQVGLGGRVTLGPLFLAVELAFEQADLLRLAGGVGLRF